MALQVWRFAAMTLTALSMGVAFSHALELRPKLQYDPALYLLLHRTLYEFFGKIGGYCEIGAVLATLVLAYLVRSVRPAFVPTAIGAGLMVLAHAVYWIWVAPTNTLMASWPLNSPPAHWMQVRNQWEYAHLARFILQLLALAALEVSVLRGTSHAVEGAGASEEPRTATRFHRRPA